MLSEIIKKRIEEKAGIKIRYSRDCDILSEKIFTDCKCKLSASTLRRLFGFIKGTKDVRMHTLDVISNYLGASSWDELIQPMDRTGKSKVKFISELKANNLKQGERYQYTYKPEAEVVIEYLGKSNFRVLAAKRSLLKPNDVFKAHILLLHHPLFILEIDRNGETIGKVIEAKVSGITSIKKVVF